MQAAGECADGGPREPVDRAVSAGRGRVEREVEIDPRREEDPEEIEAERAEVPQRVRAAAERPVERGVDALDQAGGGGLRQALGSGVHVALVQRVTP